MVGVRDSSVCDRIQNSATMPAAGRETAATQTDQRIRVLHIGKFYDPFVGGMESHIQALAEASAPAVENTVIVSNQGHRTLQEIVRGIRVIRAGRPSRGTCA